MPLNKASDFSHIINEAILNLILILIMIWRMSIYRLVKMDLFITTLLNNFVHIMI